MDVDDPNTKRPHDALFKAAFGAPENAAALARAILPESLCAAIAWGTLQHRPGTFIDRRLGDRNTDLLFSVKLDGKEALIYCLFEHQSSNDSYMPFRMLEYLTRVWRRVLIENKKEDRDDPLPVIVPVLVSHALGGWTKPLTLAELLEPDPTTILGLEPLTPNFRLALLDLTELTDADFENLALAAFPKLALWLMRDARDSEKLRTVFSNWVSLFREALAAPGGMEAVIMLLSYIAHVSGINYDDLREIIQDQLPEAEEATMTIARQLREQGREEGMQAGVLRGRIDMLAKQLALKFGEAANERRDQLEAATIEQLDRYSERLLTAQTIDDVFADR